MRTCELRQVFEAGFVQAFALERDQADRLRGRGHAQHHGRQRAGRQTAQVGHGQVGDVAQRRIGIGARLEVDLDEADAGQRARFAVVHVGGQREEALEGVGDVGFNLLRRHAVVESGHDHHGHIDRREKVHRHARHGHRSDEQHDQAEHEDEERKTQGKLRHYGSPPLAPAFRSIMPPDSCTVSDAGVEATIGLTCFVFVVLVLSANDHPIAGVEPARHFRQLRSLQAHLNGANVDVVARGRAHRPSPAAGRSAPELQRES